MAQLWVCPAQFPCDVFASLIPLIGPISQSESSTSNVDELQARIAANSDGYWLNDMSGKGIAAFNPNPYGYKVFRNIRDYGAVGEFKDNLTLNKITLTGHR